MSSCAPLAGLALALAYALTLPLAGCSKKSDEDLIREVVERALAAAGEKQAGGVVADAAPGFKGPEGADANECRRMLVGYFMQQGWIVVKKTSLDVTVEGEKGTAKLEALVAKGNEVKKPEDIVPTNADVFTFDLELSKLEGQWKFTAAKYRRSGG